MNKINRNITLNKNRIRRRLKDRKTKNTRRKKLYVRRGGDETAGQTPETIPMQPIEQTESAFLGRPEDVRTEATFPEPYLMPTEEPVGAEQETSFPFTPETATSPVLPEEPPVVETALPEQEQPSLPVLETAPLDPLEEQTVPEAVPETKPVSESEFDISQLPPPPMLDDDANEEPVVEKTAQTATEEEETSTKEEPEKKSEQETPPIQSPRKDKKFVLVRVSIPDGNTVDVQGENETTLEDTVRELKSDSSKTDTSSDNVEELKTRVNELEKIIKELNAKLNALEKRSETSTQPSSVSSSNEEPFLPPPPIIEPSDDADVGPPVSSETEQPEDDLTAFSELDD